jgi:hypothetical protein
MKLIKEFLLTTCVLMIWVSAPQSRAQGTAFTYNGRLNEGANPANGIYDLWFALYDAGTNGTMFGTLTNTATEVFNGQFIVTLDFGNVFNGANYWLETAARTNGSGEFITLSPREQITPAPYAIYAANAGHAATATTASSANSVSAANIIGTVRLAQLPGAILTNNQSGVNLTGRFTGDGSGLTNLDAVANIAIDCEADWFSARIDLGKCAARFVVTEETWVHAPQADLENFFISPTVVRFHRKRGATGLSNIVGLGVKSSQKEEFLITDHRSEERRVGKESS